MKQNVSPTDARPKRHTHNTRKCTLHGEERYHHRRDENPQCVWCPRGGHGNGVTYTECSRWCLRRCAFVFASFCSCDIINTKQTDAYVSSTKLFPIHSLTLTLTTQGNVLSACDSLSAPRLECSFSASCRVCFFPARVPSVLFPLRAVCFFFFLARVFFFRFASDPRIRATSSACPRYDFAFVPYLGDGPQQSGTACGSVAQTLPYNTHHQTTCRVCCL